MPIDPKKPKDDAEQQELPEAEVPPEQMPKKVMPPDGEMPSDEKPKDGDMPPEKKPDMPMDDDGMTFDLPLLKPGTFDASEGGTFEVNAADLEQLMNDTNELIDAGDLRPPAKIGHDDDQSAAEKLFPKGGMAALGWAKKLRMEGDQLVAQMQGVSKKFVELVKKGLWGPRSAEIVRNWKHPTTGKTYPFLLKAVAWLGSEMPAVPVHDIYGLDAPAGVKASCLASGRVTVVLLRAASAGAGGGAADEKEKKAMDAKETKEWEDKLAVETAKLAKAHEEVIDVKLAALVSDRRLAPADLPIQKRVCLALDDETMKTHLSDLAKRDQLPDLTKGGASQIGTDTAKTPKGEAALVTLARQIEKDEKVPFGEALCRASVRQPDETVTMVKDQYPGMTKLSSTVEWAERQKTVGVRG